MKTALSILALAALAVGANAQIVNGSFETEASGGSSSFLVNSTGGSFVGLSAADSWETFLYTQGVLDTNWVPAGTQAPLLNGQGNSMLYVSNSGSTGGIYQGGTAYNGSTISCWVYLVSGSVQLGIYGGNELLSSTDTTLNQWVQLSVKDDGTNNALFIGNDNGNSQPPSQFYVDMVTSQAVPEPASIGALALGLGGLFFRRRKSA